MIEPSCVSAFWWLTEVALRPREEWLASQQKRVDVVDLAFADMSTTIGDVDPGVLHGIIVIVHEVWSDPSPGNRCGVWIGTLP